MLATFCKAVGLFLFCNGAILLMKRCVFMKSRGTEQKAFIVIAQNAENLEAQLRVNAIKDTEKLNKLGNVF